MRNTLLILILLASFCLSHEASGQVILSTDSLTISCASSDTFLVPVRVQNFNDVGSCQFTLQWNSAELDYAYTTPMNPLFLGVGASAGFDTTSFINQNPAKITFAWLKFGGLSVPDSTIIFSLAFRRIGGAFTGVEFSSLPVIIEATDPLGENLAVQTLSGGVLAIDNENPTIVCPADVNITAPAPAAVNGIAATADDNCTIQNQGWSVTGATNGNFPNDPDASGAIFNFGASTVTYLTTDVGGNTASCSFTITVEPNLSSDTLTIIAQNGSASCGQNISIDITSLNFDSLGSLQFSLGWPAAQLQYISVSNLNPNLMLQSSNFGVNFVANGQLSFNWATSNVLGGTNLPPGAVLFTINFTVQNGGGNATLQFTDAPAIREAFSSAVFPPEEIPAIWVNSQLNLQDITPPQITCPANVLASAPTGSMSAVVNGLEPVNLSDNCAGNIGLAYAQSGASNGMGSGNANGTYAAGTTTITYSASDLAGNTATCSFTVTVDAGAPLTLILDTLNIDCQAGGSQVTYNLTVNGFNDIIGVQFNLNWDPAVLQFVSVDNIYPGLGLGPAQFNGFANTGSGFLQFAGGNPGGWPALADGDVFFSITFNVLDANASTTLQFTGPFEATNSNLDIVPIQTINGFFSSTDQSPPLVDCPAPIVVDAPAGQCNAIVAVPIATASDACSGIQSIERDPLGSLFDAGVTTVTFTAIDAAGNSATCSTTVTVNTNNQPSIQNCPAPIIVDAPGADCTRAVSWVDPNGIDACGQAITLTPSQPGNGDDFPVGITTVTYQAVDGNGNTAICSFTVLVRDTVAPVITCPTDYTIHVVGIGCCGQGGFNLPVGSDNCDPMVDLVGDFIPSDIFCVGQTLVTYTANDDFGNSATCTFVVTVVDSQFPVIVCPADITVMAPTDSCSAEAFWDLPTATDNCASGNIPVYSNDVPGTVFPTGVHFVTYFASDASNQESSCTFSVTVLENTPPVIEDCPSIVVVDLPGTQCDTLLDWTSPNVSDNCGLADFFSDITPPAFFSTGLDTITYVAVDLSGNTDTCRIVVFVRDMTPPVFSNCPPDFILTPVNPCTAIPNWTFPTALDNCSDVSVDSSFWRPGDAFPVGVTSVVILATDASGNFDTCQFTVSVIGLPPGFDPFPANIDSFGCSSPAFWDIPVPVGICSADSIVSSHQPGDIFPVGTTPVSYSVYENGVVILTDTFTVTVTENIPPTISCPSGPIVLSVGAYIISDPDDFIASLDTVSGCQSLEVYFDLPNASDNCNAVAVEQVGGPFPSDAFPLGSSVLQFTASDDAGNAVNCSVTVEVVPLPLLRPVATPNPGCQGDMVSIIATAIPGADYTWSGPQLQPVNNPQITIFSLAQGNTGVYTVSAAINGCTTPVDSVSIYLGARTNANDDFYDIDPSITDTFPSFLLNDILTSGVGFTVTTSPLPPGVQVTPQGQVVYTAGTEPVSVQFFYTVCTAVGCPPADTCDMAVVTIRVKDAKCAFIPNIITPNDDDSNDYFVIPCVDAVFSQGNSLVIYNQWGDKVYEMENYSNDPAKAWRGTLNGEAGKDLPDGVYYYIFIPNASEKPIKGFVEIFR